MANEFYDLFNQLFYSEEVWGYMGVIGIAVLALIVTAKEPKAFPFLVMLQALMMITYFDHIAAGGYFVWHIIILLIGAFMTGIVGVSGVKR